MENNESNNNNKKLVDKTKKTLNEMGFDIKTGQVYELYSKILNHPSYNVAKAKNEDFEKAFNNVNFEPPKNEQELTRFEKFCNDVGLGLEGLQKYYDYLEALERGDFKDKFFYGVSKEKDGFALLDPLKDTGALYVGKTGSGKSIGMKMTLLTHMLANGDNTIYFLYDEREGMGDYKEFFKLNNVVSAINNKDYIIPVIETIHKEMMERNKFFKECNSILEYEKKTKNRLPRIVLALEECMSVLSDSPIMKFSDKNEEIGTIANKFRDILRIGRTYGITVLFSTQPDPKEDLPISIKSGISMYNYFALSRLEYSFLLSKEAQLALSIPSGKAGRCYGNHDFGEIQYPYFTDNDIKSLLNKYVLGSYQQAITFNTREMKKIFKNEISKKENSIISVVNNLFKKKEVEIPQLQGIISKETFKNNLIGPQFKDAFFLGQKDDDKSLLIKKVYVSPNIGSFGSLDTGKTASLSTTATVWLANNSKNAELFIIGTEKSALDYSHLFKYEQTTSCINSVEKSISIINKIYDEFVVRFDICTNEKRTGIRNYEINNNVLINRIVVVIDESPYFLDGIKYKEEFQIEGTTAYKLYKMLRIGRSQGIYFMFSSRQVDSNHFNPSILVNLYSKLIFMGFSSKELYYVLGSEDAAKKALDNTEIGKCYSEYDGYTRIPNILGINIDEYVSKKVGINFVLNNSLV